MAKQWKRKGLGSRAVITEVYGEQTFMLTDYALWTQVKTVTHVILLV